ncbi:MAG: LAGLIDADG family homing endonuclease [bacterium]|nr:LAGLIDADG family homing endonuclease [bacterium]
MDSKKELLAYMVGVSLGDGNLSNPNKRAIRLRITCDNKYPKLIKHIIETLKTLFPKNKVSKINRITSTDISLYSNVLGKILDWKWDKGPKDLQNIKIPEWIKDNTKFTKECLRGLFQTDGSIYKDRDYLMINFVNTSPILVDDIYKLTKKLGYSPNIQKLKQSNGKIKHTIRISKDSQKFIKEINFWKK